MFLIISLGLLEILRSLEEQTGGQASVLRVFFFKLAINCLSNTSLKIKEKWFKINENLDYFQFLFVTY